MKRVRDGRLPQPLVGREATATIGRKGGYRTGVYREATAQVCTGRLPHTGYHGRLPHRVSWEATAQLMSLREDTAQLMSLREAIHPGIPTLVCLHPTHPGIHLLVYTPPSHTILGTPSASRS